MSNQEETMDKTKEEEEDDDVYAEEPQKEMATSQQNTAKIDINAWRKRQSIAFLRNPLLHRRMSRGKQLEKNSIIGVLYHCCIHLSQGVVLYLYSNVILLLVRDN
jgi:hypothetical protein